MSALEPPDNALSLQMVSLLNRGATIQYERFFAPPRLSLATSIGGRVSGGNDYDVVETGYGIEAKLWLAGKVAFVRYTRPAMVGPYLGFRFDMGLSRVAAADDGRVVGTNMRFAESINIGVRFVFFERLELSPSFGFGLHTDVDPRGRLPAWSRGDILRLGLTVGAVF
jgi:hypothetical protein